MKEMKSYLPFQYTCNKLESSNVEKSTKVSSINIENSMFTLLLLATFLSHGIAEVTTRIMPLGDEYTRGVTFPGGYRNRLYHRMTAKGYNVDFVGSQSSNPSAWLPDPDHEGHFGLTINMLDKRIEEWLDRLSVPPDVILLSIGHEDFRSEDQIDDAIQRYDALLTKISALRPCTHVIATNLIWMNGPIDDIIQAKFNPYVESIVNKHSSLGEKVSFFDMRSSISRSGYKHAGVNLNKEGNNEMAEGWAKAITKVLSPNGDNYGLKLLRADSFSNRFGLTLLFSKPIADDSADNLDNFQIDNGITILDAELDVEKRKIRLITTEQNPGVTFTVYVTGIKDRIGSERLSFIESISLTTGWRFINLSDWHTAEKYVLPQDRITKKNAIDNDILILSTMKEKYGGELMVIPGDTQVGFWDTEKFRKDLNDKLTQSEAILQAGNNCYSGMIDSFRSGGYWRLLVACEKVFLFLLFLLFAGRYNICS